MSYFKSVSNTEPCPICGKKDWCSMHYTDSNEILYFCRRKLHGNDVVSPLDGDTYTFIFFGKDNSAMYENQELRDTAKKKWLEQNGMHERKELHQKVVQTTAPVPISPSMIDLIDPLSNYKLDKIYRFFLKKLRLSHSHIRHLEKDNWTKSLIMKSFIKSLPPLQQKNHFDLSRENICTDLIEEFGSLRGVPGFYKNQSGHWTFSGFSGFLIPLYDHIGNMYRLRIRLDYPIRDENGKEKGKYKNFSSCHEKKLADESIINEFPDGCKSGSHIGLYCNRETDDFTVVYITEGEKKAFFSNQILGSPVISVPGVNSFHKLTEIFDDGYNVMDYIVARGCKILVIAYDADKATNKAVLMYEQLLVEFLQSNYGLEIALAYWNPGFGKGMDDILSIGVRPNYTSVS